jgi:uncharacterized repeat protein (TIGR02543 family)
MLINDGELGFDYIRVRLNYTLPVYNIIFVDYNGTVLQTGTVLYGSSVVAPVSPIRTGYTFSGWNPSDLTNITGDTIFTGEYTINNFTLFFEEN